MTFGSFADSDYILTRVDTPRPWYHMLGNERYLLQISQLGSGFSSYKSIFANLVTRRSWPDDDAGRFVYIRDAESGDIWSPTVWPVETDTTRFDSWSCTYQPACMLWKAERDGLSTEMRLTVSSADDAELYSLSIENTRESSRTLDLFFFLEWSFAGTPPAAGMSITTDFDGRCLSADLEVPEEYRLHQTGFLAASEPVVGFEGNRRDFLGQPGNIAAPRAMVSGKCTNLPHRRLVEQPGGVLQVQVKLAPGERKEVRFVVGVCENLDSVPETYTRCLTSEYFDAEFARANTEWEKFTEQQILESSDVTPGSEMSAWANRWLRVQLEQNFRHCRWAVKRGYRDVLQDSAGLRLFDPGRARERIIEAISHQKLSGHAPRQYPVCHLEEYDWNDYRDSSFWIVYALAKYIKESGDFGILAEKVGFFDSDDRDTVLGHAKRALDYLWRERGEHGLCLLGKGDWLDSLNTAGIEGRGESVWLSMALCYALREFKQLVAYAGDGSASLCEARCDEMREIINTHCWDGEWYLMATNDAGQAIGSASCPDGGKIFLNPQSWAVLAGVSDRERTERAMRSCDDLLLFDTGYLCFAPMYTSYDPTVGRIGLWMSESASVYSHAVTFKIAADCVLGEGDRAWETLQRIVPAAGAVPVEETAAEPFLAPNAYHGPEWPVPNWSYQGWWTASASWLTQIMIEDIWGARADYGGLHIDPCLPTHWTEARIIRSFRGDTYDIRISKPEGICKGSVTLTLDGDAVDGSTITPVGDGGLHVVEAVIRPAGEHEERDLVGNAKVSTR